MIGARTARLQIEPLGRSHAPGLVEALAHPAVGRFIGGPDVTTVDALHARLDRLARGSGRPDEIWLNFAVRRADDGVVLGRLEATTNGDWAEIAYLLGPAHQGRGYAREAVRWLIEALGAAAIDEVWAAVHPDNLRSIRLLEALGFTRRSTTTRELGSYDPGDLRFERR